MKARLTKYCSYILPITLEKTFSKKNGVLEITLNKGKKELNTAKANFSFGSLHKVFQFAFKKFPLNKKKVKSVLILGFGAGSVKTILRHDLGFEGLIVGVEYDEILIELAQKHFNINLTNKTEIEIIDAMKYVAVGKKKFDLIIIDLFKDLEVPAQFLATDFYLKLQRLLNNKGEILLNVITSSDEIAKLKQTFKEIGFSYKQEEFYLNNVTNHLFLLNTI